MEDHVMNLAALAFVLFFVVLVVCGTLVHAYLYANKAFQSGKVINSKKVPMSAASFSQTATIPTRSGALDLSYGGFGVRNEDAASISIRRFMLYGVIGILLICVALVVLVLSVTLF
jgi:hypothetical protein